MELAVVVVPGVGAGRRLDTQAGQLWTIRRFAFQKFAESDHFCRRG